MTDGKLLLINREDFYEILRKEAPLAVKLLWSFVQELSARLRQTNADLKLARSGDGGPDEIMDLDEDLLVSDSGGGFTRLREPSVDEELDPDEIETVEFEDAEPDLGFEHEMSAQSPAAPAPAPAAAVAAPPAVAAPVPTVAAPAATRRKTMPYMGAPGQTTPSDQLDITLGDGSSED